MNKLFFILFGFIFITQINRAQTGLEVAEDFQVKDVEGITHNLYTYLEDNKIVVVPFFTTTCGSCNIYTPEIVESFQDFGCNQGDVFYLGVNWGANNIGVIDFMAVHAVEYPCASGLEGLGNLVNEQYEIASHITALVILPDGTIAGNYYGPNAYPTRDSLNNLLLSLGAEMQNCTLGYENNKKTRPSIYPNPATDYIDISFNQPNSCESKIKIWNMMGLLIYSQDINFNNKKNHQIDISQLPEGVYLIQLTQESNIIINQQLIKQ